MWLLYLSWNNYFSWRLGSLYFKCICKLHQDVTQHLQKNVTIKFVNKQQSCCYLEHSVETEIGQNGGGLRQPIVNDWKSISKRKLYWDEIAASSKFKVARFNCIIRITIMIQAKKLLLESPLTIPVGKIKTLYISVC